MVLICRKRSMATTMATENMENMVAMVTENMGNMVLTGTMEITQIATMAIRMINP